MLLKLVQVEQELDEVEVPWKVPVGVKQHFEVVQALEELFWEAVSSEVLEQGQQRSGVEEVLEAFGVIVWTA